MRLEEQEKKNKTKENKEWAKVNYSLVIVYDVKWNGSHRLLSTIYNICTYTSILFKMMSHVLNALLTDLLSYSCILCTHTHTMDNSSKYNT